MKLSERIQMCADERAARGDVYDGTLEGMWAADAAALEADAAHYKRALKWLAEQLSVRDCLHEPFDDCNACDQPLTAVRTCNIAAALAATEEATP